MKNPLNASTLYCCATPIGHLGDVSHRLIDVLGNVSCIYAEDTRVTKGLLQRFDLATRLLSLEKFNEVQRIESVLEALREGHSLALVSDAGTPGVSDPGGRLVDAVWSAGFTVSPIPGPSALTSLVSVAGIDETAFYFAGFVPKKSGDFDRLLSTLAPLECPIFFFDSPKRIYANLTAVAKHYPDAHVVLGKELTKVHETILRGPIDTVLSQLESVMMKGEWCMILQLGPIAAQNVDIIVRELKDVGLNRKQIIYVAQNAYGLNKNDVYSAYLSLEKDSDK